MPTAVKPTLPELYSRMRFALRALENSITMDDIERGRLLRELRDDSRQAWERHLAESAGIQLRNYRKQAEPELEDEPA